MTLLRTSLTLILAGAMTACSFSIEDGNDGGDAASTVDDDAGTGADAASDDAALATDGALGSDGAADDGSAAEDGAEPGTIIGAAGGSVSKEGVAVVEIPPAALPTDTEVRVRGLKASELPRQPPLALAGNAVELLPHGQLFNAAVHVTMDYDAQHDPSTLKLIWLEDERDMDWEVFEGASFVAGKASFSSMMFGYYAVAITPTPECFPGPAVAACDGACTVSQYCANNTTCTPIARSKLCGNTRIIALHNGESQVDEPSVDAMAKTFSAQCGNTFTVASDKDPSWVSPCSGEVLVGAGTTILMAGGPATQAGLLQYDRRVSPVYMDWQGSIRARSGASLLTIDRESINRGHDYIVIQMFPDTRRGALIISAFGQDGTGTLAATWYFNHVVVPSISDGSRSWNRYLILEWQDNGNFTADAADAWVVRASDAIDDSAAPSYETPWKSNFSGTLESNASDQYAMGYKFTPSASGRITGLGGFFDGSKLVKLFRGSTQLASVRVTAANSWSYVNISPIAVAAGTQYTVAVYLAGSGGTRRTPISTLPYSFGNIRIDAPTQVSTLLDPNAIPSANFTPATVMLGQADIMFQKD